jgi:flagellar motor switch protein FliG
MAQLLPPATLRASVPVLSLKAKAAIVVRLLLNEGTEISLEDLPEALQAQLTLQMGAMRTVDRSTLGSVIDELSEELSQIGLSFPHGMVGQPQLRAEV